MDEKLVGIKEIGKALTGDLSEVEAMRQLIAMKKAGYRVETDADGVWIVSRADVDLFLNGGKKPKPAPKADKKEGALGDPADDGRFRMEHKGRGKWAIIDTTTGEQVGDETFDKNTAAAMVTEANADNEWIARHEKTDNE